ncbi:DUF3293 domain-containing protein [Candidatus Nitrosacidococcus sp. I8]|uniref:DUF3293 domain-containing protein n=1 Tax=Candidatus Nitrosacidococcus sp. I8 TaxID=2942908 RepID=UPI0022263C14|nr:DUF3293 domain-containing protein [Candidatus Nitrosacidococcus sp. I8]CAH9018923.1 hypothetical protein NURINAE_01220 [Candidatus Nitrosacidococcus sp. I8]
MNPVYSETHFKTPFYITNWANEFAIITAYATTGEIWTKERNNRADKNLWSELQKQSDWIKRVTGYSPTSGHAEPGWAAEISFDIACNMGQLFYQDAIYYVENDQLYISFCDHRRFKVLIGDFRSRVSYKNSAKEYSKRLNAP